MIADLAIAVAEAQERLANEVDRPKPRSRAAWRVLVATRTAARHAVIALGKALGPSTALVYFDALNQLNTLSNPQPISSATLRDEWAAAWRAYAATLPAERA